MVTAEISQPSSEPVSFLELPVDTGHSGIQAGCAVFLAAIVVSFVVFNWLLPDAPGVVIILSLFTAGSLSWMVENRLKSNHTPRRKLLVEPETIKISRHSVEEMSVDPRKQVNVLAWRFEVPRNGRVKKGWYVVALGLEQDEMLLPVYTFAAPERFKDIPLAHHFAPLQRMDKLPKETGSVREMKLAGQQRRLHDAERMRHLNGAELTLEAFEEYIVYLQEHYPAWMLR